MRSPSSMVANLVGREEIFRELLKLPSSPESIIESFADTDRARELFQGFQTATARVGATTYFIKNIVRYDVPALDGGDSRACYGRILSIYQAKDSPGIMAVIEPVVLKGDKGDSDAMDVGSATRFRQGLPVHIPRRRSSKCDIADLPYTAVVLGLPARVNQDQSARGARCRQRSAADNQTKA